MKYFLFVSVLFLVCFSSFQAQSQSLNDLRKLGMKPVREANKLKQDQRRLERLTRSRNKKVDQTSDTGDTIFWSDFRYIPERGTIGEHRATFKKVHGEQVKLFLDENRRYKEVFFDPKFNTYYANVGRIDTIEENYEVIGWYPGYNPEDTAVRFKPGLLTTVSYDYYLPDPTFGKAQPDAGDTVYHLQAWKNGFVQKMKAANPNIKVLLNVHMYFDEDVETLLSNSYAPQNLIEDVADLVNTYEADGVELSFATPSPKDSLAFNDFLENFAAKIRGGGNSKKIVVLTLDPFMDNGIYNIPRLNDAVDFFVLNSFNIIYAVNGSPRPLAPLSTVEDQPNISKSFDHYFYGSGVDMNKVILGLPLMAPKWEIQTDFPSSCKKCLKEKGRGSFGMYADFELKDNLSYDAIMSTYKQRYGEPAYDYITGSSFYLTQDDPPELIWFEGKTSLDVKFKWAKDNEFGGVGIWELGNDGNYDDVWDLLALNYGKDSLVIIEPVAFQNDKLYGLMENVSNHRKHIGAGVVILIGFILVGFLLTFLDWRLREVFFRNYDYRLFIAIIVLILSAIPVTLYLIPTGNAKAKVPSEFISDFVENHNLTVSPETSEDLYTQISFAKMPLEKRKAIVSEWDSLTIIKDLSKYRKRSETMISDSLKQLDVEADKRETILELYNEVFDEQEDSDRIKRIWEQVRAELQSDLDSVPLNDVIDLMKSSSMYEFEKQAGAELQLKDLHKTYKQRSMVNALGEPFKDTLSAMIKNYVKNNDGTGMPANAYNTALDSLVENYLSQVLPRLEQKIRDDEAAVIGAQNMSEPTVVVKRGDGSWEDALEIMTSALVGAMMMYLVTLIYVRRRNKLP